jgi:hypothetical protein
MAFKGVTGLGSLVGELARRPELARLVFIAACRGPGPATTGTGEPALPHTVTDGEVLGERFEIVHVHGA